MNRAALVYVAFAGILVMLATFVQDAELTLEHVAWSCLLALPLGVATLRGGLGAERFEYPSASFIVLGVWIGAMAPSFVVDNPEAHLLFRYTELGVIVGRWMFFAWCLVFVIAAGPTQRNHVRLEPRTLDILAISAPIMIAIAYQIVSGGFSNYQGVREATPLPVGGVGSVALTIGSSALPALPSLFLTVWMRASSPALRWLARAGFVAVWLLLFLAGGRSPIGFAMGVCFFAARVLGLRFRPGISAAALVALPIAFFLVFNYRTALGKSTERVSSVSGFSSLAVDSTQAVVSHSSTREDAMSSFSDNARSRLWYGPQFFAVVDEWLSTGTEFHGTFLDGIIRSLPSWFSDSKNQLADEYGIEFALKQTGRFPDIDLGPMPWMQWLFEFGVVGIAVGAALYGRLVGWLARRVAVTASLHEALFWYAILSAVCSPELVTDGLFIVARNVGVIVGSAYVLVFVFGRLTSQEHTGLGASPAARASELPNGRA